MSSAEEHRVPSHAFRVRRGLGWFAGPVLLLALLVVVVTQPRTAFAQEVGDLSILASVLWAAVACAHAARAGGPAGRAWGMLAAATGIWAAAQVCWTFYGITRDHVYPFPSLADAGFLGWSLPVVAALLMFPRSSLRRSSGLRELLDAAVIGGSVLFVSWAVVLGPLYQSGGAGVARVVGLGYPVIDVALASLVLALGARVPPAQRRPWLLLGSGLVLLAVTDSNYVLQTLAGRTGTTGSVLALGWVGAFLLIAAASRVRVDEIAPDRLRHFTVLQELLPALPLLTAALVAAIYPVREDAFLVANGGLLLLLAVAQQGLKAVEKVRLANGLEATIAQRTAELTSADARFRALVQSSDDAILSKTRGGILTSWNPAAQRLFGYTEDEVLGQPVDLLVPESRRAEELEIRQLAASGAAFRRDYDTERLRKDGSVVAVSLTVSPIYEGDVIAGVSAIARDITDRQAREQELAAARTAAIEGSRAKSEFLATMSHEIRTPMNGVIGLTGLLLRTELDDLQRRYATGVRGAGEALLGIIDDILDFSKLEAGKVELEQVDFDPRELVEEVGVLLAGTAGTKGLELIAYCEPAVPPTLRGDPGRLRQVLINLAANAVKFTPSGQVVLRVAPAFASHGQEGEGVPLLFEVSDTGIGLTADDRVRLFEPFSQADTSTTRRFGGTGLGLAICRRLVGAMGGEIGVSSELGVGSTFHFSVQLPTGAPRSGHRASQHSLAGLRVLVVDDNETNRLILATQLADWDMRPEACEDASAALAALRQAAADRAPYDLALLDLCMPGMDGLELASVIACDAALSGTRCMILTSAGDQRGARADRAGVREWVSKPVRLSELHDALVRMAAPMPSSEPVARVPRSPAASPTVRGGAFSWWRTTRSTSWWPRVCSPTWATASRWRQLAGKPWPPSTSERSTRC